MGSCASRTKIPDDITVHEEPTPTPELDEIDSESDISIDEICDFYIETEDLSKDEVQLGKVLENYPKPTYPDKHLQLPWASNIHWFSKKKEQSNGITNKYTTDLLDARAREAPLYLVFEDLIGYLTAGLDEYSASDFLIARSLIIWMSNIAANIERFKEEEGHPLSPTGFLALLSQGKSTYATLFTVLCRMAGLKCSLIEGICKAGKPYKPGGNRLVECVWTAVYLDKQWYIVHPLWVCRSIVKHNADGWIKFESDGEFVESRKKLAEPANHVRHAFQEYYFLTDPKEFIFYCCAYHEDWQLLKNPISQDEFLKQPYIFPPFFGLDLKLVSEKTCSLVSKDGQSEVKLQPSGKKADPTYVWYEILLHETQNTISKEIQMLLRPENIQKLVAMVRCNGRWTFKVRFPTTGTYKLRLFGSTTTDYLLRLCEFRIDCNEVCDVCIPLPINPGIVGFGPGPAIEASGLCSTSHPNGQILFNTNKPITVTFKVDRKVKNDILIKSSLHTIMDRKSMIPVNIELSNTASKEMIQKYLEFSMVVDISQDGEYVLQISTTLESDPQAYQIVCNYLLTSTDQEVEQPKIQESSPQHSARKSKVKKRKNGLNTNVFSLGSKDGGGKKDRKNTYHKDERNHTSDVISTNVRKTMIRPKDSPQLGRPEPHSSIFSSAKSNSTRTTRLSYTTDQERQAIYLLQQAIDSCAGNARFKENINAIKMAVKQCLRENIPADDKYLQAAYIRIKYLQARKELLKSNSTHLRDHRVRQALRTMSDMLMQSEKEELDKV